MHYAKFLLAVATALPTVTSRATPHTRNGKRIVETTTLPNLHVIDWVLTDEVAPPSHDEDNLDKLITPLNGPKGAVPYLRAVPTSDSIDKKPRPQDLTKRSATGHKYAAVKEQVNNHGGGASFSLFDPYLEDPSSDFSLIQTSISTNVQNSYFGNIVQTLEAGWQKYPMRNPAPVHFFTFFNANGYGGFAENINGYNAEYGGWVQVDTDVYPGYEFSPHSVDGGAQYDIDLQYRLDGDKWWLAVNGRRIGYYPTSIFSTNVTGTSLATTATQIEFFGEIYSANDYTTTDMGSGEFPNAGYSKSAYIRNMVYADTNDAVQNFTSNLDNVVTNPDLYQLEAYFNTMGNWGSYMYVGGPGYGGNVGS